MKLRSFLMIATAVTVAGCVDKVELDKGVVDEELPPGSPLPGPAAGKADGDAIRASITIESAHPYTNNFDRTFTQGQFNYSTQENADNPKMNNIVRVDWRPTSNDSIYFTFKDWYSDQRGSEITAGPNKWGFFNTHYLNTDRGGSANYAKIIRSNLVLDSDFGIRQQTEQF